MSPSRIRSGVTELLCDRFMDFSNGIVGNKSDLGAPIRHLRRANNVTFDRRRGLGVRRGYRDILDAVLPFEPHSLMKFYAASANKAFAGAGAFVYLMTDGGGYTAQTLPFAVSSRWWHSVNINGALVAVQEGGSNPPMAYNGTDWLSMAYPTPDSTTVTAAVAAGGAVDAGTHLYRIRWLFSNGASLVNGTKSAAPAAGNLTVNLSTIPISARSDYIGFQVERQKLSDATTWYFVGSVISAVTTTYSDTASDASLGTIIPAQPGPYGAAPHFDNIFVYRGRLFGMLGGNLYPGQAVADVIPGVGCFNFNATQSFPISDIDDGDAGQLAVTQVDRMVVLKGKSGHALSGYDLNSFTMTPLFRGMGAAGTRAACSNGPDVFFYDGENRLFVLSGSKPERLGDPQIGHYLNEVTATVAAQAKVVLANYLGNRILVAYPSIPSTFNNEVLALRLVDGRWEHYTNMRIADVLVQARRDDFAGASMLFADPVVQAAAGSQAYVDSPSFAVWTDSRAAQTQYWAQRLTKLGVAQFGANGSIVSAAVAGSLGGVSICSDAAGTALFVAYAADQGGNGGFNRIFIQKLDATGVAQFGSGIALSTPPAYNFACSNPFILSDGSGGAFVIWQSTEGAGKIFIQRVDSSGTPLWTVGGVVLQNINSTLPVLISDGSGGIYATFIKGPTPQTVRIVRVNSSGGFIFGGTGAGTDVGSSTNNTTRSQCRLVGGNLMVVRSITTNSTAQAFVVGPTGTLLYTSANLVPAITFFNASPVIVADISGGAIIAWNARLPAGGDFVQCMRVDGTANAVWPATSVYTNIGSGSSFIVRVADGSGGIIIATTDASPIQVYAFRVDASGNLTWTLGMDTAAHAPQSPLICSDGQGGCIVGWTRNSTDFYAQRISTGGLTLWTANGVVESATTGLQTGQQVAFTNSPAAEPPVNTSDGYHVWSAFDGTSDARPKDATLTGSAIPWYAELPESDAGEPDFLKAYEALSIFPKVGFATVSANLRLDGGDKTSAVPVQVAAQGPKWGASGLSVKADTLYWGPDVGSHPSQPHTWAGDSSTVVRSGLEQGLTGYKHQLALAASPTTDLQVDGVVIDYRRLPDRTF